MRQVVGVDLDNTLATYDQVLHFAAVERRLIGPHVEASKRAIRDAIRGLPNGDEAWQGLQALVYGRRMAEAKLAEGAPTFFQLCTKQQLPVYVISHKTEYGNFDPSRTNLRDAALNWMRNNRFFEAEGLNLTPEHVYFESTRLEKIQRIKSLRCTHFIDDLEETFLEESFPADVDKILYSQGLNTLTLPEVKVAASWKEITDYVFNNLG